MASKKLYLLPENLLQEFLKNKNEPTINTPKISDTIFDSDITEKKISQLKNDLISSLKTDNLDTQSLNEYKNSLSKLLDLQKHNPEKTEIANGPERSEWTPPEEGQKHKKGVDDKDGGDGDDDEDDDENDTTTNENESLKMDKKQIAKEEGQKVKNVTFPPTSTEIKPIIKTPKKLKKTKSTPSPGTPKSSPRVSVNTMLDHDMLKYENDKTQNSAMKLDLWLAKNPSHGIKKLSAEGNSFTINDKKIKGGDIHDILIDLARYTRTKELVMESPGVRPGEERVLKALAEAGLPESLIQNVRRRTVYKTIVRSMNDDSVTRDLKRHQGSFLSDDYSTPTPKQQRLLSMFGSFNDT